MEVSEIAEVNSHCLGELPWALAGEGRILALNINHNDMLGHELHGRTELHSSRCPLLYISRAVVFQIFFFNLMLSSEGLQCSGMCLTLDLLTYSQP